MAAAGPNEANEWKSNATADRVEDARPSSDPLSPMPTLENSKTC